MAENPVIKKFGTVSGAPRQAPADLSVNDLNAMYQKPAYSGPRPGQRYMTLDDVVQRTGAMLAALLAAGSIAWVIGPEHVSVPLLLVSLMGSLAVGLYMSFTGKANATLCLLYAALE